MNLLQRLTNNLPYNDFFDNVSTSVSTFTGKLQGIALGVIIACIVITGFMFIFGEGPSRTAKKWLMYIIIGAVLIFGAATLGDTVKNVSGF
ncbi:MULTISPECIES: TrbC/VirB2 family protein [Bacillati]|uniref:TrbC/VirB2 family protein n=1 Tax=Bacillati TaxID=1783272 RepID=UPI0035E32F34